MFVFIGLTTVLTGAGVRPILADAVVPRERLPAA